MTYYTGESIAEFLTVAGCAVEFVEMVKAPQLLQYHFNFKKLKDFKALKNALLMLQYETRQEVTEAPSTRAHFSIIMKRDERETFHTLQQGETMRKAAPLSVLLGKDTNGEIITAKLSDLPHLLIAGTTGSGKSCALNSFITSLACYNKPAALGFVMFDLKQTELTTFDELPHLEAPTITDADEAAPMFRALVREMRSRYEEIKKGASPDDFKTLVIIIDELADLVTQCPEVKPHLIELLAKARAANIFLIVATQSPRAKVLDGATLANLPSRLALTCASSRESVLILGHKGAENLTGSGDAILKLNGTTTEHRIQCPYISKSQIKTLINKSKGD